LDNINLIIFETIDEIITTIEEEEKKEADIDKVVEEVIDT